MTEEEYERTPIFFSLLLLLVLIGLFIWALSSCAGAPRFPGCHPGQHQCQTDVECEDEEAYLLDMDEGRQR